MLANSKPKIFDIEDIMDPGDELKSICSQNTCNENDWCIVSKDNIEHNILHIVLRDGKHWYRAQSVADIFYVLRINGDDSYMLVAGNTGKGVKPIEGNPKILIDISTVSELKGYFIDQNLSIGAGNTLTEFMEILKEAVDTEYFDYLKVVINHLELVANVAIRNIGTIAGNLMLKHMHRNFPSDIFLLLQAIGAEVNILLTPDVTKSVTIKDFLAENMKGKIIKNILMPPFSRENKLVSFKVSARPRNAYAIVNAAFFYKLSQNNTVQKCRIAYGGLSPNFSRAKNTENMLLGKILFKNSTLKNASTVLSQELVVKENASDSSVQYRKQLALGLFYKDLLQLCPDDILILNYKSGAVSLHETHPVSKGSQIFISDPTMWPINQPVTKVEALIQCAGEAIYAEDLHKLPKEVYATFVLTSVWKGMIHSIDPKEALERPGVIAFYTANDIPGINSFTAPEDPNSLTNEEILCSGEVCYFNQPLGILVAESKDIANEAALLVKVTYRNVTKPRIDIRINKNSTQKTTLFRSIKGTSRGNNIVKVIKGEETIFGQYHFCLENMACVSWPTDDGLKVSSTSHYIDADQLMISRSLNIDQNSIDIEVRRVGGSFGLKLSRQTLVTTACSLVAYKLNRPCRFLMPLTIQTRAIGKRMPSSTNYEIGVDRNGVIQYLNYDIYNDNGYIVNELLIQFTACTYYNCYKKERWNFRSFNTITDTPSNSWFRSQGALESIHSTEIIMERVAYELGLDPLEVRLNNLDTDQFSDILEMIETIKTNSNYAKRRDIVESYNSSNRWKKRGLRFTLMNWQSSEPFLLNITLSVYHGDGSVAITHGGVEIGQGINTKAIQVCAYYLNIPMSKIKVKPSSTTANPNNSSTAASLTSQSVAIGVQRCCEQLLQRLKPIKAEMANPTWEELIAKAYTVGVNLQANGVCDFNDTFKYNVYGVTLAEVEVDILTGEWQLIQVDLIEDVGRSVSPAIDIGQLEGAFIQGVGYHTMEELVYDPNTGELLTDRTWNYFVPEGTDIPTIFNVYFSRRSYSYDVILGSKACSEPPICMGVVVPLAMREAIVSARRDTGIPTNQWFQIDGPYTVEKICLACETNLEDYKFN
ncbi:unnamed protein product, partial [Brenthis ino]